MKQNITLNLDKNLKQSIEEEELYEVAKKNALEILSRGFRMGGKITYSRDSLHER